MSRQLTPEERDALSEDQLIAYDIQHVLRGRGVSAATQRSIVRDHIRQERAAKARDAADAALARKISEGDSPEDIVRALADIRRARAEREAAEAAHRNTGRLAAARRAVGVSNPIGVERRRAGRPAWSAERFHARYREAIAEVGLDANDEQIAASSAFGFADERQLRRLASRFGRPVIE